MTRKIDEIETLGAKLYQLINQQSYFRNDFLLDSRIEEAITSAIYEGAHSTRAQAQQLIASGQKPVNKDEWMLLNNYEAMNWIQTNRIEEANLKTILHLHRMVTRNTLEGDDLNFSGMLRNDKVFVDTHEGVKHDLLTSSVNEVIALIADNPRYIHPLLKGILFHYFIAYVHPFFDGNGRTARAVFYFQSMKDRLEYIQLLSVSAYLKEHGSQYQEAFNKVVENELDITYFVEFCLNSIYNALEAVSKKITHLLKMNELKETLSLSANQIGLLQRLALHSFRKISIDEYANQISMSREIARKELKQLHGLRFLDETKQGKKLLYTINKLNLEKGLKPTSN